MEISVFSAEKLKKTVGGLEKAHIKAASKGGSQVVPMCPTCHKKFDKGLATDTQPAKVGLTRAQYNHNRPKPGPRKPKPPESPVEEYLKETEKATQELIFGKKRKKSNEKEVMSQLWMF